MHRASADDATADRDPGPDPRRFAGVILVDSRGWILLQERDEHPRIDPEKWGLAGGHVDPGEDFEPAARRELEEETGVRLPAGGLQRFGEFVVDHREAYGTWDVMQVFVAATDLTDADIDCREGRQIVFVDPAEARGLDLTAAATDIVPAFLDSDLYARLGGTSRQRRGLTVHAVSSMGAEDVVVAPDGTVYTGTEDGAIWALDPEAGSTRRVADTGGRPLGLELLPDDDLLVCDARRGVLRVSPRSGAVEVLVDRINGEPMRFCNNAAVAADGTVWFSDSSLRYGIERWKDDFVQDTRTGRLIRRAPDGAVEVVLTGLAFANGVALAADESYVAVAECRGRTVVRLWLSGPRAGERDHLVTDLPGYPDNISRGSDGLIWVAVASPVDGLVERLGSAPMVLRRAVTRIPEALQPRPAQTIRVQAYDDEGRLVHDIDLDPPARGRGYHMVTGVREHDGRVWLGSLHEPAVAVLDRP